MAESKSIKLKVCGMRDKDNILDVASLAPDFMGFIFFRDSKRFVGDDFEVSQEFPDSVNRVGVFVNEHTDRIAPIAKQHRLTLVQLHGVEGPSQCEELRRNGLRVIKAFPLDNDFDFDRVNAFKKYVDYFLFDTKGEYYGGNGVAFDWDILHRYDQQVPFFLSGGLSLKNIANIGALKGMNLAAIDINSGVESAVGVKDIELIRELGTKLKSL